MPRHRQGRTSPAPASVIGNVVKNIGTMLKERAVVSPQLEAYVERCANVRMDYTQMKRSTSSTKGATGKRPF